jgi:quercetin dioxygenase-like cupin family protein
MSTKLDAKTAEQEPNAKFGMETVLLDNETTRISEWVFQPGEQTGWHFHDWDYVTVQQSGGCLEISAADGTVRMVDYSPGVTNFRKAPIEHIAKNVSVKSLKFSRLNIKIARASN